MRMTQEVRVEETDNPKKCQREKSDNKREKKQNTSNKIKPSKSTQE